MALLVVVLVCAVAGGPGRAALAAPLEDPRYGGANLGSPVDPHPGNMMRNPATIGMLKDTHVFLLGGLRVDHGRVRRAAIRSDTGNPGPDADLHFDSQRFVSLTPTGYFGLTSDLGSKLFVIGVGLLSPMAEWQRYAAPVSSPNPSQDGPLRYHRIRSQWYHLFLPGVVAIRAHKRLLIGIGGTYVRSMLNMSFGRDRSLRNGQVPPYEAGQATERVTLLGGANSFCFNLGVVLRLPWNLDVGLSYRSKVVSVDKRNITAEGAARVTRWVPEEGAWRTYSGRAHTTYDLPDSLTLGASWRRGSWTFGLGLEWARWSEQQDLEFTLTGNELRGQAGMANWDLSFRHYRGFQDVFRLSGSVAHRFGERLKLTVGLLYESPAVKREWVNPAAMDSHKADLALGLVWRPHRRVGIYLGYSLVLAPDVRVRDSGFDPGHLARCVEDRVDILWSDNCRRAMEGKGLPSAAGRYFMMTHRFGIGISYDHI